MIERACILAETDFVGEGDLAGSMQADAGPGFGGGRGLSSGLRGNSHPAPLVEVEREHIVRTLHQVRGNKAVAARCSDQPPCVLPATGAAWPASADTDDVARRGGFVAQAIADEVFRLIEFARRHQALRRSRVLVVEIPKVSGLVPENARRGGYGFLRRGWRGRARGSLRFHPDVILLDVTMPSSMARSVPSPQVRSGDAA